MLKLFPTGAPLAAIFLASTALAQSAPPSGSSPDEQPPHFSSPSRTPAPASAPDMQEVLDEQAALGARPIETLSPSEARRQPSLADAVHALMKRKGIPVQPNASVSTEDASYGDDPLEWARIYKPAKESSRPKPLIVYFHGGGWVIADVRTYDATPRMLASKLNAVVVSVEYRKAPEAKFPAQHEDAARAYGWALKRAASWGADPTRVALAGESAGGNLAVATAIYARDHHLTAPLHVLAVYPIANARTDLPSKIGDANDKPLNKPMLGWFTHYWSRTPADPNDPRINLVAADLKGLPPITIINAQNDPLRSDGESLATALRDSGDQVVQRTYPGVTHEFFGAYDIVHGAVEADRFAVDRLRESLGSPAD